MAHQYRQRILVIVTSSGEPASFVWREAAFRVAEVFARWHLRDRWWESRAEARVVVDAAPLVGATESDRHYFRLRCVEGLICEVYRDAASGAWVLDRVLD